MIRAILEFVIPLIAAGMLSEMSRHSRRLLDDAQADIATAIGTVSAEKRAAAYREVAIDLNHRLHETQARLELCEKERNHRED